jgi:hypothetical protein
VLSLLLVFIISTATLSVLLWIAARFFQGYIYTEPSAGMYWQAPTAGAVLGLFLTFWCLLVRMAPESIPREPLFFTNSVDLFDRPAKNLWAVKKGGQTVAYVSHREGQNRFRYYDTTVAARPWNATQVEAIEIEAEGAKKRFERTKRGEGEYPKFVSSDGWYIYEYDDGPRGIPERGAWGRVLGNLFLNFFHLALWFACLWLILRFQWLHALMLAPVIWIAMTLLVIPLTLSYI